MDAPSPTKVEEVYNFATIRTVVLVVAVVFRWMVVLRQVELSVSVGISHCHARFCRDSALTPPAHLNTQCDSTANVEHIHTTHIEAV